MGGPGSGRRKGTGFKFKGTKSKPHTTIKLTPDRKGEKGEYKAVVARRTFKSFGRSRR